MTKKNNINFKFDKKMITASISFGLFIILTILVFTKVFNPIDEAFESLIIGIRNDKLTKMMINMTNLGGAYCLCVISILLFFLIKNKKVPIKITINLISAFLTSQLLKVIFRRPRPNGLLLTTARGFSYPSGHTMVSFAFYVYLLLLICNKVNNKIVKLLLIISTTLLIVLIAFSRIYFSVHYLSDILAGILLGITYLNIFTKITIKESK